jgi:hypothetical protein
MAFFMSDVFKFVGHFKCRTKMSGTIENIKIYDTTFIRSSKRTGKQWKRPTFNFVKFVGHKKTFGLFCSVSA